ncbi:MAG: amino acid ABC transporter ATP-binding protein [Bacteriovoracia bacterium]
MIEGNNIYKSYGLFTALNGVSFSVKPGSVVAIVGPSGSGKSTLIRLINGLESFQKGSLIVDGINVSDPKNLVALRRKTGMVFQGFNLFPHLTVLENLTLAPQRVLKLNKVQSETLSFALLERVGLQDQAYKYPDELSGGQMQRTAIARALVMKPKILLFDEPTSALDPEMTGEVLETMQKLIKEGITMLVVTHEMGFAKEVADQLLFLDQGRIVEQTTPNDFFSNPKTERARIFLRKVLSHQ